MRVGFGYDAHRFATGRPLVIGGVELETDQGLDGHSDGDVLVHAIIDALLGAAALGDLGTHFSENDVEAGAYSTGLLPKVSEILRSAGYRIVNIDATVVIQGVRISPAREQIRKNVASALEIEVNQVSVKATTTDALGFSGRGEGAEAYAVALLDSAKAQ